MADEHVPPTNPPHWKQRKVTKKNYSQISVYMSQGEKEAFDRICEYWACSKAEAFRTMVRYFDVNLGLSKPPKK